MSCSEGVEVVKRIAQRVWILASLVPE
ncbi:hypothetical protein J2850_006347 [Azospirillum picis]|uniref:Transposase n=1 Tax=Azospirillum picis TaxID=488438 RepID=A0ABU0MVT1_9PROT|nr:hypothetical protein [Azospirillum picis]MDQ0537439.1 hypothetical protein [Azospirillum picis]